MALGGINPAMAASAGRMVPVGGNQINPFEAINQIANTQRTLLDVQGKSQELDARNTAAQIMALYPNINDGFAAIQKSPALAPYIPQIYQSLAETGRIQAETQRSIAGTGQINQQVANTGLSSFYQGLMTLDGRQSPQYNQAQFNNFIRNGRATITDPTARAAYDTATASAKAYLDSTGWTGDRLTSAVYATVLPHVDAAQSSAYRIGIQLPAGQVPVAPPAGGNPPPGTPANPNPEQPAGPAAPGSPMNVLPPRAPDIQPAPQAAPAAAAPAAAPAAPAPQTAAAPGGGAPQAQPIPASPNLAPGGAVQVQQPAAPQWDPNRAGTSFLGTPLAADYAKLPNMMRPRTNLTTDNTGKWVGEPYGSMANAAQQDFETSGATAYATSLAAEQSLAGLANTFNTMQQGNAFTQPGTLAPLRNGINSALHTIANIVGYKGELPDLGPTAAGSDVENQARTFSAGIIKSMLPGQIHAAQTIAETVNSMPGTENTWLGGQTIMASLNAQIHRVADFRKFQLSWIDDQHNMGVQHPNLINSIEAFNQQFPAAQYQRKALDAIGMNANMTVNDIFKWENSKALNTDQGNAIIRNNFDLTTGRLKPNSVWGRMLGVTEPTQATQTTQ